MTQEQQLRQALETLERYIKELSLHAGETTAYADQLWNRIRASVGVLRELAYYYDYGKFLCEHKVAGYTLADILVWQVDHFKAYLDRPLEVNRYRQEKLLLSAFDVMLQMEENPDFYASKMQNETGTDQKAK